MLNCLVLSGLIVSEGLRKSSPNVTIFFLQNFSLNSIAYIYLLVKFLFCLFFCFFFMFISYQLWWMKMYIFYLRYMAAAVVFPCTFCFLHFPRFLFLHFPFFLHFQRPYFACMEYCAWFFFFRSGDFDPLTFDLSTSKLPNISAAELGHFMTFYVETSHSVSTLHVPVSLIFDFWSNDCTSI